MVELSKTFEDKVDNVNNMLNKGNQPVHDALKGLKDEVGVLTQDIQRVSTDLANLKQQDTIPKTASLKQQDTVPKTVVPESNPEVAKHKQSVEVSVKRYRELQKERDAQLGEY